MNKIKKIYALFAIMLIFTSCFNSDSVFDDNILDSYKLAFFNNLKEVNLTDKQYRKLSDDELDIGLNTDEMKIRSGFYSEENVFSQESIYNMYMDDMMITWPRTFSVLDDGEPLYGFINKDSEVIIPPKYVEAENFIDGIAAVQFPYIESSKLDLMQIIDVHTSCQNIYIDETDKAVEKLIDYDGYSFYGGISEVCKRSKAEDPNYFVINTNGEKIYKGKKRVNRITDLGHNLGEREVNEHSNIKREYNILVDESGEVLIDSKQKYLDFQGAGYDYVFGIKNFSDKYFKYFKSDKSYGEYDLKFAILDTKGNVVSKWIDYNKENKTIMNRYTFDFFVSDDLVLIYDTITEKFGYLSVTGDIAIEPIYEYASTFSEGLACVSDGEKYGFIDTTGKLVIPMKYSLFNNIKSRYQRTIFGIESEDKLEQLYTSFYYTRFSDGICPVNENGKFGFIDKNGEYIVEPMFDELTNFYEGIATGRIGNNYYILEKPIK